MRSLLLAGVAVLLPLIAVGQTAGSFVADGRPMGAEALNKSYTPKRDAALFPSVVDSLTKAVDIAAMRAQGSDATALIQAAWAKGAARIPCGDYRVVGTLTAPASNTALLGESMGCVRFFSNGTTGDVIVVPAGIGNVRVSGIQFLTNQVRTGGAVIRTSGNSVTIEDIGIEGYGTAGGKWFDGVVFDGGTSFLSKLRNFKLFNVANDCIRIQGRAVDTWISDGVGFFCGNGVRLQSASAVHMAALDLVAASGSAILINPSAATGEGVDAVYVTHGIWADNSAGPGVSVAGDGPVTELHLTDLWASVSGTSNPATSSAVINMPSPGLVLNNAALNGATITGLRAKSNGGIGLSIAAGKNITVVGAQVFDNGASYGVAPPNGTSLSTTRYPGISVSGAADFVSISASISGAGGYETAKGLPNKQSYGLVRQAGNGGQTFTLMGGQWPGNVTGDYTIGMASGDKIVDLGNGH